MTLEIIDATQNRPLESPWIPFLRVAIYWLVLGSVISFFLSKDPAEPWIRVKWMFFLWFLVVADLVSLASFISEMLDWKVGSNKNQVLMIIRASSWGVIKLACLGLLAITLYSAKQIPPVALFLGVSTMVVIPVFGELRLSSR